MISCPLSCVCRDQSDLKLLSRDSENPAHEPGCLQLCRLMLSCLSFPASSRGLRATIRPRHPCYILQSLAFGGCFSVRAHSLLFFPLPLQKPVFSGPSSNLAMHLPNPPPHLISSFCFTPVNRMSLVHFGTKAE